MNFPESAGIVGDLVVNALFLLVDGLAAYRLRSCLRTKTGRTQPLFLISAAYLASVFIIAIIFAVTMRSTMFTIVRYMCFFIFLHVPLMLTYICLLVVSRRVRLWLCIGLIALLPAVYIYAFHIEPRWLEITRYSFSSPSLAGLTRPITIVQLTDFQTDAIGDYERRVLAEVAALKPDLLLCPGDWLQPSRAAEFEPLSREFKKAYLAAKIRPTFGAYGVMGNLESRQRLQQIFVDLDIEPIFDETRIIELPGCTVRLVGLDLQTSRFASKDDILEIVGSKAPAELPIIMGHVPDFIISLEETWPTRFLALAGHTHGGQVQLPFIGPVMTLSHIPRRYADAFTSYGAGVISVARGTGMERSSAPRLRFLCRPELRVITLDPGT